MGRREGGLGEGVSYDCWMLGVADGVDNLTHPVIDGADVVGSVVGTMNALHATGNSSLLQACLSSVTPKSLDEGRREGVGSGGGWKLNAREKTWCTQAEWLVCYVSRAGGGEGEGKRVLERCVCVETLWMGVWTGGHNLTRPGSGSPRHRSWSKRPPR